MEAGRGGRRPLLRLPVLGALLAAAALVGGARAQEVPASQPAQSLGAEALFYETVSKPLNNALQEISLLIGLPVAGVGLPEIEVSGEFFADDTVSFLDFFCGTYRLDWFEFDGEILVTDARARRQVGYEFANELDALSFKLEMNKHIKNRSKFPEKLELSGNVYVLTLDAPGVFQTRVAELFGTVEPPADGAGTVAAAGQESAIGQEAGEVAAVGGKEVAEPQIGPPVDDAEIDLKTIEAPSVRVDARGVRAGTPRVRVETRQIVQVAHVPRLGVMRFALRHAWVEDKVIENAGSGGSPVKIPGVAGIFTQLVTAARAAQDDAKSSAASPFAGLTPVAGAALAEPTAARAATASPTAVPTGPGNTKGLPNITMDIRSNALLVYDDLSYRDFYKEVIRDLDRPLQLIEIEAMVIDVTADRIGDLGISWSVAAGPVAVNFSGGFEIGAAAALGDIDLIVNNNQFMARLRALTSTGASRVVSQPSVLVMDNHPASIETTTRFYVKVSGTNTAALYPVTTGTRVNVIPHVIDDADVRRRRIQMLVSIRDGKVNNAANAQVEGLPQITERNINTQAVVYHGESLLIGGHKYTEESDSVAGVPLLSDLPLIGLLFSKRAERSVEYIRLFLLRPTLVEMSFDRVEAAEALLEASPLLSGASRTLALPAIGRRAELPADYSRSLLESVRAATGTNFPEDTAQTLLLRILDGIAGASGREAPERGLLRGGTLPAAAVAARH